MRRLGRFRWAEQGPADSDAASVLVRGDHRDRRRQTRGVARGGASWRRCAHRGASDRALAHPPHAARERAGGGACDLDRKASAAADAAGGEARGRCLLAPPRQKLSRSTSQSPPMPPARWSSRAAPCTARAARRSAHSWCSPQGTESSPPRCSSKSCAFTMTALGPTRVPTPSRAGRRRAASAATRKPALGRGARPSG